MNFSFLSNLTPARIDAASLAGASLKVRIVGFSARLISHGPAVKIGNQIIDSFTVFSGERTVSRSPTTAQVKSSIELVLGIKLTSVEIVA